MTEEDKEKEERKPEPEPEPTPTPSGGEHITESKEISENEVMEDEYKNEK